MALGDDLTPFFNTDHFAVAATYNAATVNGQFDEETVIINDMEVLAPTFLCAESDVSAVAHGDTITINGSNYTVRGTQPDGTGLMLLILEGP